MSTKADALRARIAELVEEYAAVALAPQPFVPGATPVPPSGKVIGAAELKNMVEASLDGWLTTGRFNAEFEKRLAAFLGVQHLITVNSGSSANLVAFSTLTSPRLGERAIRPGDEVIAVAAGFPTTVNPILQFGAVPVFVDVEARHLQHRREPGRGGDQPAARAPSCSRTRSAIRSISGRSRRSASKHELWLIEDCCDALGATYDGTAGRHLRRHRHVELLSRAPHHHGRGRRGLHQRSRAEDDRGESFRDWGRDCYCAPGKDNTCGKRFGWKLGDLPEGYDHKYIYSHLGYNLKITDMQAACGLAQLERAPTNSSPRRKANFAYPARAPRARARSCSSCPRPRRAPIRPGSAFP